MINITKLSDHLAEEAYDNFKKMDRNYKKNMKAQYEIYIKLKDEIESIKEKKELFEEDDFKAMLRDFKNEEAKHLSNWDIPHAKMKAILVVSLSRYFPVTDAWFLKYEINLDKGKIQLTVSVDNDEPYNYCASASIDDESRVGCIDILDYYLRSLDQPIRKVA